MGTALVDMVGLINMQRAEPADEERLAGARRLLAEGADLEARNHLGRTALHVAVHGCMGRTPVALSHDLLDAGARADSIDDRGESLLASAAGARGEHFEDPAHNALLLALVQRLVASGAPLDTGTESPVAASVRTRREAMMLWLLSQGGSAQGTLEGRPALELAAAAPGTPLTTIEALVEAGAALSPMVLLEAIQVGRPEVLALLARLGASADASFRAEDGRTFLHAAAKSGDLALIEELLAARPGKKILDAAAQKTKRTALMVAIHAGHDAVALRLLGAKTKAKGSDHQRYTVLHLAAQAGRAGLIQPLLDRGAEPGKVDYEKQTPLHLAAFCGHTQTVQALLATGHYSPDQADRDGSTPRELARLNGHEEIVALFDAV